MALRCWIGFLACLFTSACAKEPATAVIVQVRSEGRVAARTAAIEVLVRRGRGEDASDVQALRQEGGEPFVFTLERSTREDRFEVLANALDASGDLVSARLVRSAYASAEVRVLTIVLDDPACTANVCTELVAPDELCPFTGSASALDCNPDAGPLDAGLDVGAELGPVDRGIGDALDEGAPDMGRVGCAAGSGARPEVAAECIRPFQVSDELVAPPVPDRCGVPIEGPPVTGCIGGERVTGCDPSSGLEGGMFGGGEGTPERPFVICDPRQLFLYLTRDGTTFDGSHVRVVCDLDMVGRTIDETDEPPSLRGGSFRGDCGAGEHVRVRNLHSSRSFSNALFGELADGAEVGNLLFDDVVICGEAPSPCRTQTAGLALAASGSIIEDVHFRGAAIRSQRGSQSSTRAAGLVGDLGARYARASDLPAGEFIPRCLPTVGTELPTILRRASLEGQVVAEFEGRDDMDGFAAGIAGSARPEARMSQVLVQGVVSGAGGTSGLVGIGAARNETPLPSVREAVVRAVVYAGAGGVSGVSGGRGAFRDVLFHGAVYTDGDRAAAFVGEDLAAAPTPTLSNAIVASTVSLGTAGERGPIHAFGSFAPRTTNVRFASECYDLRLSAAADAVERTPPVGSLPEPLLGDIGRGVFATDPWAAAAGGLPILTFVDAFPALPPWSDAAAASYVDASSI